MIPVNEPLLDGNEEAYLHQCIRDGWISSGGPFVERLEAGVAARLGRRHGIAVTNGSAALEVAVASLDLGPGDEVILPSLTIISCAAAVVRAGATPVLVDSTSDTWNLDVTGIEAAITSRTRAIMAVHTYGLPVDMAPVLDLARQHGLSVIEDAAEAIGLDYRGQPCGSFGDISILSFYPNKHITTGEGGMVLTNDRHLAERARSLRNLCFVPERRFLHHELGWNFRMSNLQAAVGVAQLERLDAHLEKKRHIGSRYQTLLASVPGVQLPVATTDYSENIYWVFGIVLTDDAPVDASSLMTQLRQHGIGTRPFFWPMHQQPVFLDQGLFSGVTLPVAERLATRGLYLPSGLALTEEQADCVAHTLKDILLQ